MAKVLGLGIPLALGLTASWPWREADPPLPNKPAVSYVTVTATTPQLYQAHSARWWASRAVRARREANWSHHAVRRLRRALNTSRHDWKPTVDYAIDLASRVFRISETKMRAVAWCESRFQPWATNGRYSGLFQLGWSPFGLSPYDPVANALSAAQTVAHDGSWRQWECG